MMIGLLSEITEKKCVKDGRVSCTRQQQFVRNISSNSGVFVLKNCI